ncbi:TPA: hypothetical protein ACFOVJ_002049 [Neisseria meningitidis]|uniref:hypothetical protein n=1 Tax=Neisseria meningitidis TaxID=487 RepID=UPI00046DE76F|nr:hypothetical protein [Neisseria meningitidis]MBH2277224.1 hypothetical protein [Neisseria meningitidis]MBH2379634.1 hypothetical protein [Neisseria meningitidis]MBH2387209.1 hypothetical protein [Neisseria meningitidis]MBH5879664.1 hypothetical protein [Neisseria meningitidis]MBJ1827852.1 hypothetical protein [Neisseria meningitidis]
MLELSTYCVSPSAGSVVDFDLKKRGGVGQDVFRGTPDCGGVCLYFAEGFKNRVVGYIGCTVLVCARSGQGAMGKFARDAV